MKILTFQILEMNYCFDDPCKNAAKCISGDEHFKCECMIGFKGHTCEGGFN